MNFRELIEWHEPEFLDIGSQFSSSACDAYNVALFLTSGILGTIRAKKISTLFVCMASGVMASDFIETFQLYHLRSFDLGDIMTITVGCILGILVMMPLVVRRMISLRRNLGSVFDDDRRVFLASIILSVA